MLGLGTIIEIMIQGEPKEFLAAAAGLEAATTAPTQRAVSSALFEILISASHLSRRGVSLRHTQDRAGMQSLCEDSSRQLQRFRKSRLTEITGSLTGPRAGERIGPDGQWQATGFVDRKG